MQHVTETMIGRAPVRFEAYVRTEGPLFAAAIHLNQPEWMLDEFLKERDKKHQQSPYDSLPDLLPDGLEVGTWEKVDGRFNDYFLVTGRLVPSKFGGPDWAMTPDEVCEWIDDE